MLRVKGKARAQRQMMVSMKHLGIPKSLCKGTDNQEGLGEGLGSVSHALVMHNCGSHSCCCINVGRASRQAPLHWNDNMMLPLLIALLMASKGQAKDQQG